MRCDYAKRMLSDSGGCSGIGGSNRPGGGERLGLHRAGQCDGADFAAANHTPLVAGHRRGSGQRIGVRI